MVPSNSRNYLSEKEKDWTQIKDFLTLPQRDQSPGNEEKMVSGTYVDPDTIKNKLEYPVHFFKNDNLNFQQF